MTKEKKDIITNREFTIINNPPPRKRRHPRADEMIPDDENEDTLEETLIGMEYDLDTGEEDWKEEDEVELDEEEATPANEPSHHPNP